MLDKSVSLFTVSGRLTTDDEIDLGQVYGSSCHPYFITRKQHCSQQQTTANKQQIAKQGKICRGVPRLLAGIVFVCKYLKAYIYFIHIVKFRRMFFDLACT